MGELLEAGDVIPVIDRRYSFEEVPKAIAHLEAGHATEKILVTVW